MRTTMCASPHDRPDPDFSERFYQTHARRYAEVAHQFLQSIYIKSSHPALKSDTDLLERLRDLVPRGRGLDAGCGAGARDVHDFWQKGYDIQGVDAVAENIREAKALHPEIADRVALADLRQPIDFPDASFDFVICNGVIQHIAPLIVFEVTLCEFARVLKPSGILQLLFKNGRGVKTVYDRDYGAERSFQLYDENDVLQTLRSYGLELVEAESPEVLGGIMYFTDPKPMDHCVFYVRRRG
ncbi:MAG: class I SAM-dependent methyltransferase [Candidatus Tectomicrobia bacterium]|nr:class I SAM-dependent methyltransferase [Candidatus Tectomicrobia bacterium]